MGIKLNVTVLFSINPPPPIYTRPLVGRSIKFSFGACLCCVREVVIMEMFWHAASESFGRGCGNADQDPTAPFGVQRLPLIDQKQARQHVRDSQPHEDR